MTLGQKTLIVFFAGCFVLGIFSGGAYDLFSLRRYSAARSKSAEDRKKTGNILTFVEDYSFFILLSCAYLVLSYHLVSGRFRPFSLLFLLFGYLFYRKTVKDRFSKLLYLTFKAVFGLLKTVFRPVFCAAACIFRAAAVFPVLRITTRFLIKKDEKTVARFFR